MVVVFFQINCVLSVFICINRPNILRNRNAHHCYFRVLKIVDAFLVLSLFHLFIIYYITPNVVAAVVVVIVVVATAAAAAAAAIISFVFAFTRPSSACTCGALV